MPVSFARKLEFFLRQFGGEYDVRLVPLALTVDQVAEYDLPKVPIKQSEKRREGFEARYGEGAVELDALEALRPGELRRIVESAIERYRAPARRARRAITRLAVEIGREIADIRDVVIAEHEEELASLRDEFEDVRDAVAIEQAAIAELIEDCRARIAEHESAIAEHLDGWRERVAPVWETISDAIEERAPDLDEIEWPQPEPADESDDPLFDSTRKYVDQIDHYKVHQGKDGAQ